jgi:hypothetical protein
MRLGKVPLERCSLNSSIRHTCFWYGASVPRSRFLNFSWIATAREFGHPVPKPKGWRLLLA